MADFNTALVAKRALKMSVDSIFGDPTLTESSRVDVLKQTAAEYGQYMRLPLDHALETTAELASDASAPPAMIQKIIKSADHVEQARRKAEQARQAAERAAAAGRKLHKEPRKAEKELREATPAEAAKLVRAAFADRIEEVRKAHPHLSGAQARSRVYSELPGIRKVMVEGTGRAYGERGPSLELAKQEHASSAQIEAAAKAAEIMKADPSLSEHQAYERAYRTPGLMKRLLAEQRGEG